MASVRKHGKGFQVRYYANGVRQHEAFSTLEEAEIRKKEVELDQKRGISVEAAPNTVKFATLAAAVVDHYDVNDLRSRDDIETRFRLHLVPFFGNRKAVAITPAMINSYIAMRKGKGAPNSTINRELEAFRRAYNLAKQTGAVTRVPYVPRLKEENVRTGFFTREEVGRLCKHLKKPFDSFVLFAFLTAWRLDEIRNLLWENVDFERGEIRIVTSKNGEGRVFPMTDELRTLLNAVKPVKHFPAPYVFTVFSRWRDKDGRLQQGWTHVGQFSKQWARACYKAGLPCTLETERFIVQRGRDKGQERVRVKRIIASRLFHDLRRSGVRELAKTLGERRAMVRTGHKTRSVFDRYNVVSDFDLAEDRKLLDAASSGRLMPEDGADSGSRSGKKNR